MINQFFIQEILSSRGKNVPQLLSRLMRIFPVIGFDIVYMGLYDLFTIPNKTLGILLQMATNKYTETKMMQTTHKRRQTHPSHGCNLEKPQMDCVCYT